VRAPGFVVACNRCGHRTAQGELQFCPSCGTFLPWSGERVNLAPLPEPTAVPFPAPPEPPGADDEPAGWFGRFWRAHPARVWHERVAAPWRDRWYAWPPERAGALSAIEVHEAPPAFIAQEEVVPRGAPVEIRPRWPEHLASARRRVDDEVHDPVEVAAFEGRLARVACRACEAANPATRALCRRCGEPLAALAGMPASVREPVVATERSALRARRLRRRAARGAPLAAGARPRRWSRLESAKGSRSMRVLARVGAVVTGIALLAVFVHPVSAPVRSSVARGFTDLRDALEIRYLPVTPVGAVASSELPGHPAADAVDGIRNTSWESAAVRDGVGQWIQVSFAGPRTVSAVGLLSGDQSTPQSFRSETRPSVLAWHWSNGEVTTVRPADVADFQSFHVHEQRVRWVRVVVEGVYRSPVGHSVAIAELEFFRLS
jgi:ribosomal protein L37E